MSEQTEDSNKFICCLKEAILNVNKIVDETHLHNLTIVCRNHTFYIDYKQFIKKVIKAMFINEKHLEVDCNSINQVEHLVDDLACYEKTRGFYNAYVLLLIIMIIIGFIGNSLVCFAFLKCKKLRMNVENYFITSLAVADLLVILFQIPVKIHTTLHNDHFCASLEVCRMYAISDELFFAASITNLLVLTIDRYITITRPFDYRRIISPFRSKVMITLVWAYASLWGILTNYNPATGLLDRFMIKNSHCRVTEENYLYTWIELAIVFFIPCIVMLFVYIRIFRISLSHAKNIEHEVRRVSAQRRSSNGGRNSISRISFLIQQSSFFTNRKLEARATKVLVIVYGTFVVCWLPVVIAAYVGSISRAKGEIKHINDAVYVIFCEILPILNSILNPFIYGVFHRDFKSCLKKILGISYLQYERRGSGGTQRKLDIEEHFARTVASRFCSISLSTARSNTDQNSNLDTSYQDTTLDSQDHISNTDIPLKTEEKIIKSLDYPVYNIPEDFYPVSEMSEDDFSGTVTQEECKENAFILTEFKLSGILEALNEYGGIKNNFEDIQTSNTASEKSHFLSK